LPNIYYDYDRGADIRYHLLKGPVILSNDEVGIEVRYKGRLLGFGQAVAELLGDAFNPLPSHAIFHGVRIAHTQFLPGNRVKLIPERNQNV
jgi:hypothetical protein